MIPPANLATMLAIAFLMSACLLALCGCETLRVGFSTDYGTFSYELPRPTSSK
jgi:hypothetical protein